MSRLEEKRRDLYELPPLRVYGAMAIAMLDYPYRLGRVDENSPTAARNAEHYIIDSGIGDTDITTDDIIEKANYLDADVVVPKDIIGDPITSAENITEMYERRDELENDDSIFIIPLQTSDEIDYTESQRLLPQLDGVECWYGVGGIKELGARSQIIEAIQCRESIGIDEHLHAFGCGASMPWVRTIVRCPWLLDSLDLSTPAQLSSRGMMLHGNCDKLDVELPRGKKCTSLNTQLAQFSIMLLNWYLSGLPREEDLNYKIQDPKLEAILQEHEAWYRSQTTDSAVQTASAHQ